VSVTIYDVGGRRVRELARDVVPRVDGDELTWDGRGEGGEMSAPGVYFVRVEAGGVGAVVRVTRVR
jgi:hypothetical protein